MVDITEVAEKVDSKSKFIAFLVLLREDFINNKDEWENDTLDRYFDGLIGFSTDMTGYFKNAGKEVDTENISWNMMAEMLLAASIYE